MRSVSLLLLATLSHALVAPRTRAVASGARRSPAPLSEAPRSETRLAALPDEDELFGGYTAKQRLREETAAAERDKLARQRRFVGILQEQSRAVAQRREAEKVVMTAAERSLNGSIIDTFAKASPERKAKIRERM